MRLWWQFEAKNSATGRLQAARAPEDRPPVSDVRAKVVPWTFTHRV